MCYLEIPSRHNSSVFSAWHLVHVSEPFLDKIKIKHLEEAEPSARNKNLGTKKTGLNSPAVLRDTPHSLIACDNHCCTNTQIIIRQHACIRCFHTYTTMTAVTAWVNIFRTMDRVACSTATNTF
jgi:hypothetical protein